MVSNNDLKLRGNDGGSYFNALTLDMSEAGAATFNSTVTAPNSNIIQWQSVVTGTTLTAVAGRAYPINTTSNACTVTLPSSASVGDQVQIVDYAGTFSTNNITLTSSLNIEGSTVDLSLKQIEKV